MYGSGAVSCSCSLLIRGPNLARCQAEAPLIALCRFSKPALMNKYKEMLNKPLSTWNAEDWRQWDNEIEIRDRFIGVPRLSVVITTVELESDCTAVITAEAKATLKPSAMLSTGTPVGHPDFSIWSKTRTLKAPHQ